MFMLVALIDQQQNQVISIALVR